MHINDTNCFVFFVLTLSLALSIDIIWKLPHPNLAFQVFVILLTVAALVENMVKATHTHWILSAIILPMLSTMVPDLFHGLGLYTNSNFA